MGKGVTNLSCIFFDCVQYFVLASLWVKLKSVDN